jgi:probable HAF family extracellular repeat protein
MMLQTKRLIVGAAIGLACLAVGATPPVYRIEVLEGIPGGAAGSNGKAINDDGVVAGIGYASGGGLPVWIAAVWRPGAAVRVLGTLPGHKRSSANGINARGEVVGDSRPEDGDTQAFIWSEDAGMRGLEPLSDQHPGNYAGALNASGQVVGSSQTKNGLAYHAVHWDPAGRVTEIGALAGKRRNSAAAAINDEGRVVGWYDTRDFMHAYTWTAATGMKKLRALTTASHTWARAINARGDAVGNDVHYDAQHEMRSHAVLWKASGKLQELTPYDADNQNDFARAINNRGFVVGSTGTNGSSAVLWEPSGAVHLLDDLIDPNDPLKDRVHLQTADGVNRHGVIVANGSLDGNYVAFRLVPQ